MSLRRGFTLIELLVTIGIIASLIGLLIPAVQKVRHTAARLQCQNNLKQMSLASHHYESANHVLPQGIATTPVSQQTLSMHVSLLPYLDQASVYRQAEIDCANMPITHIAPPHVGLRTLIPGYQCPSDSRQTWLHRTSSTSVVVALTGYLAVSGVGKEGTTTGVSYTGSNTKTSDISDGTSNTLYIGERPPTPDNECGWWYSISTVSVGGPVLSVSSLRGFADGSVNLPDYLSCPMGPYAYTRGDVNNICSANHFWSLHPGGSNFAFCDGSVRFLSYSADAILPALATRAGGETVTIPD
jgi:prepilin-type N-terminal cleavage/methylation domain-containing protein/prepilin-type processing-associated H-X9-DG protein